MSEVAKIKQPSPRHYIDKKTVWNDKNGATWICLEIWESGSGYEIEFLVLNGPKPIQFVNIPWMDVYRSIRSKGMQRANI